MTRFRSSSAASLAAARLRPKHPRFVKVTRLSLHRPSMVEAQPPTEIRPAQLLVKYKARVICSALAGVALRQPLPLVPVRLRAEQY